MTSPQTIDKHVLELLKKLEVKYNPVMVPLQIEEYSKPSNCFNNVKIKKEKDGGDIVYGWAILKGIGLYEAEWHAVWINNNGILIDITPREKEDVQIMFVQTDVKDYDYHNEFIDNVRLNISGDMLIDHLIYATEKSQKLLSYLKRIDDSFLQGDPILNYGINEINIVKNTISEMIMKGENSYSKCFCKNNIPYKYCHGLDTINFINTIFLETERNYFTNTNSLNE